MLEVQSELRVMLRALHLSGMADSFAELATKAATAHLTYESYLSEVVQCECILREQRRIARLLRQSGLPPDKTFRTLQLDRFPLNIQQHVEHLRSGAFTADAINVVAAGKPGVGKSHLLAALGHELILQGKAVLWTSTATLVQQLLVAKRELRLPHALAKLDRYTCLILDDIGYVQHDRDEMEVLFTLLAERYERRSVAISTNLVFSEWERIFKDPMTTLAAIDRVVHHSVILDLMGMESYRAQEATSQLQSSTPSRQATAATRSQECCMTTSTTPAAARNDPRDDSPPSPAPQRCLVCPRPRRSGRGRFCSDACRQRAFRLRHTALPNLEEELLRTALRRRATLIAHTVYECSSCDVRYLGERRCSECNHFCRALGIGGACQDCEQPILLSDLLDLEV